MDLIATIYTKPLQSLQIRNKSCTLRNINDNFAKMAPTPQILERLLHISLPKPKPLVNNRPDFIRFKSSQHFLKLVLPTIQNAFESDVANQSEDVDVDVGFWVGFFSGDVAG